MAIVLPTPTTETLVATNVQITGVVNNIEEGRFEIHYMILLEDGTPYKRGQVVINGYDDVKALYAEQDAAMATGKTFEVASAEILYNKVLASL